MSVRQYVSQDIASYSGYSTYKDVLSIECVGTTQRLMDAPADDSHEEGDHDTVKTTTTTQREEVVVNENDTKEDDENDDENDEEGDNDHDEDSDDVEEEDEEVTAGPTVLPPPTVSPRLHVVIINDIVDLPPLPTPKYNFKRREALGGITLVVSCIVVFVALTHGVALTAVMPKPTPQRPPSTTTTTTHKVFVILIYSQIGLAVICLLGLLLVDPGVLKRTQMSCFPIPPQTQEWLAAVAAVGTPTEAKDDAPTLPSSNSPSPRSNVQNQPFSLAPPPPPELYISSGSATATNDDGRIYCARCLIWRQPNIHYFHCMTCQRCVAYFDHHCTVFGRCIGGNKSHLGQFLCRGNYRFFVGILAMGILGYLTTATVLLYAFSLRFGAKWAVPIGLVILIWFQGMVVNRGPGGFCRQCRQFFVECSDFLYKLCCKRKSNGRRRR